MPAALSAPQRPHFTCLIPPVETRLSGQDNGEEDAPPREEARAVGAAAPRCGEPRRALALAHEQPQYVANRGRRLSDGSGDRLQGRRELLGPVVKAGAPDAGPVV